MRRREFITLLLDWARAQDDLGRSPPLRLGDTTNES
jgi:hypothetical protein